MTTPPAAPPAPTAKLAGNPIAPSAAIPPAPARTVLLLGASNISLSLRPILRTLRGGLDGELNVLIAAGHGRSYADRTITFGRSLPGLLRCGAWKAYAGRPDGPPPLVCFTDVGNDLLYDTPPATLVGWVAACHDRLGGRAEVALTLPPSKRAAALPAWQYHTARGILFPSFHPLPWGEMRRRADELHDRLSEFARGRSVAPLEPPADWYGLDPIHIRRGKRREAWAQIFSGWRSFEPRGEAALPRLPPVWGRAEKVRIFGRSCSTAQPVWRGAGITLSLY